MNKSSLIRGCSFMIGVALLTFPILSSASVALPPLSNFASGKVLKAADLGAMLQNLMDLKQGQGTVSAATGPWIQGSNSLTANVDRLQLQSNGPGIYFNELDQAASRKDYGHWRIIADQNALYFEDWEQPSGGSEYAQQDEFLSFMRAPTPSGSNTGNHVIQWQYDFLGSGVRPLNIGANWASPTQPQNPQTLSFVALNRSTNTLVNALQIVPNNANPNVFIPNGTLQVAGAVTTGDALTTKGTNAGLHMYDRTTNSPSSWWYSSSPGVTSLYSDVSHKDAVTVVGDASGSKLCVGQTCVTETQLKALLKLINN